MSPLTLNQLYEAAPYGRARAGVFYTPLVSAMAKFEIDSPLRVACFLAQIIHESGSFQYTEEIADGSEYEGRRDLGNTVPGDGKRYKGRGLIQITGRANYERCGEALKIDLLTTPELLETPIYACSSAAWFWKTNGCNELAEVGKFASITKRINGGYNGMDDRIIHYIRARKAIGI